MTVQTTSSQQQSPKSGRSQKIVRVKQKDGTIKVYSYDRDKPAVKPPAVTDVGTIRYYIRQWQASPEWRRYKPATQRNYETYLRKLTDISALPLKSITKAHVYQLRDVIAEASGNGAATVFKRVMSAFLAWCEERSYVDYNVARSVKSLPGGELPTWDKDQADRAQQSWPRSLARTVILARFTGLRRSDLIAMRWSQIVDDTIHVTLIKRKTGDDAQTVAIPVHPTLSEHLATWRSGSEYVLTNDAGDPWRCDLLTDAICYRCKADKFRDKSGRLLSLHGLRKLAITSLAEAGCSTQEIMAITGHSTLAMIEKYTRQANKSMLAKSGMQRLSGVTKTV